MTTWDDARIREGFIYDGGESDFHDPINGAREQRRIAGEIFDRWLEAHDAALLASRVSTPPSEEWEYGVEYTLFGDERAVSSMGMEAAREAAGRDSSRRFMRRTKAVPAGPWEPVQADPDSLEREQGESRQLEPEEER